MEAIEACDLLKPTSGADRFDVSRLGLAEYAECRVAAISSLAKCLSGSVREMD